MKRLFKCISLGLSVLAVGATISVPVLMTKASSNQKEFTSKITANKPGKGELVSFLPTALTEFYQLPDLVNSYQDKLNTIRDLITYNDELASWVNYDSYDSSKVLELYEKYDMYRPTNNILSWNSSLSAKQYRVIVSQDKDFKRIERDYTVNGDNTSVILENPYTGVKYYWQIVATLNDNSVKYSNIFEFASASLPRAIYLPGISNVRDMGGLTNLTGETTKEGLVYRSAKLEHATSEAVNEIKNNLCIKTDLDLRGIGEGSDNPLNLTNYYRHSSPYEYSGGVSNWISIELTGEYSLAPSFGNAIKVLANPNNYPVIYHSTFGRDRAGLMGICLDYLCGMSDETTFKNYAISLFSVAGALSKESLDLYNRFIRIRDFISTFSGNNMSEKMENYLVTRCGVTHDECVMVRNILLGKTSVPFEVGVANLENYSNYVRVTFRQQGKENIVRLYEKGSLIENPNTSGFGSWYHDGVIWDFSNDVINEDIYLDYVETSGNTVVIHFVGIDKNDEVLCIPSGTTINFDNYAIDGYTFTVYDANFNVVTSALINSNTVFNIVYKYNGGYVPKKNSKIFVIAGQSNAVGVGHFEYLHTIIPKNKMEEYANGYSNVLLTGYFDNKTIDGFIPVKVDDALNNSMPSTFGFESGLADRLSKAYPNETIYIVKYATGATSLNYDFASPSSSRISICVDYDASKERGWLYTGMVDTLHNAIDYISESTGTIPLIEGFMWMQGESDASYEKAKNNYLTTFNNLVKDFKNEFSGSLGHKFAIYDAGISKEWYYYQDINNAKKSRVDDNNVYLDTIARGLTTTYEPIGNVDTAHYDAGCYIDLGHFFADAYLEHNNFYYAAPKLTINAPSSINAKLNNDTSVNVITLFNNSNVNSYLSFVSKDKSIFTIDGNGIIHPVGVGSSSLRIQAYYNGEVTTKEVTISITN